MTRRSQRSLKPILGSKRKSRIFWIKVFSVLTATYKFSSRSVFLLSIVSLIFRDILLSRDLCYAFMKKFLASEILNCVLLRLDGLFKCCSLDYADKFSLSYLLIVFKRLIMNWLLPISSGISSWGFDSRWPKWASSVLPKNGESGSSYVPCECFMSWPSVAMDELLSDEEEISLGSNSDEDCDPRSISYSACSLNLELGNFKVGFFLKFIPRFSRNDYAWSSVCLFDANFSIGLTFEDEIAKNGWLLFLSWCILFSKSCCELLRPWSWSRPTESRRPESFSTSSLSTSPFFKRLLAFIPNCRGELASKGKLLWRLFYWFNRLTCWSWRCQISSWWSPLPPMSFSWLTMKLFGLEKLSTCTNFKSFFVIANWSVIKSIIKLMKDV